MVLRRPIRQDTHPVAQGISDHSSLLEKILLFALSVPMVLGVLVIFFRDGVNIPVLVGGITGLVIALRLYRRHVQGVR